MRSKSIPWSGLLLFCSGLFIASTFAMKWMEGDLVFNNEPVSIFGLELYYSKDKIIEIFSGINARIKTILGYHLYFDFIFMAGVYPGIASLCMIASEKINGRALKIILFGLAFLQLFAWGFDIIENYYLLKWLRQPVIGEEFGFYHVVVYTKWGIALTGIFFALGIFIIKRFSKGRDPAKYRD
jgi:hypothetical protein